MRIDPKGTIGGYPALLVRKTLRDLRGDFAWGVPALEAAAKLSPGTGRALAKALHMEGLIEAAGRGTWTVTQAGRTMSAATAARRISRATAERALAQFLDRVARVNNDPYFLSRVTRVVLFGSMLRPEVEWLSDVDLAVQLGAKEADFDKLRAQNEERVEQLTVLGRRFRNFLEQEFWWFLETFQFLKGRSRVIALLTTTWRRPWCWQFRTDCSSDCRKNSRRSQVRKYRNRRNGRGGPAGARSERQWESMDGKPT